MTIEYSDFEIELRRQGGGQYEARVMRSPVGPGRVAALFSPPLGDRLDSWLTALEHRVRSSAQDRRDLVSSCGSAAPELQVEPGELGERLFAGLFTGPVRDAFMRSRGMIEEASSEARRKGIRLRVAFDRAEDFGPLAALPWELLSWGGEYPRLRRGGVNRRRERVSIPQEVLDLG